MGCLALLAFLALPFAEVAVARDLAAEVGWDSTLFLGLAVMVVGVSLARRARQAASGHLPNYPTVDFYEIGDLFAVCQALNAAP